MQYRVANSHSPTSSPATSPPSTRAGTSDRGGSSPRVAKAGAWGRLSKYQPNILDEQTEHDSQATCALLLITQRAASVSQAILFVNGGFRPSLRKGSMREAGGGM